MSLVTILGAGPAGLMAAHAAEQNGHSVEIIWQGTKSVIDGAQWLQRPIPGLTDDIEPTMITYAKVGTVDGYAQKAYGESEAQVSWDTFVSGDRPGWPLRDAYEDLWHRYSDRLLAFDMVPDDIRKLLNRRADAQVFCSIPAKAICLDVLAHDFKEQPVVFTPEPYVTVPNMIIYNGRDSDEWYRTSCLFDSCSTEYAVHDDRIPIAAYIQGARHGIKPISNNCSCWSSYPNLIKIGRFGTWRRGVLVDHAYLEAKDRT